MKQQLEAMKLALEGAANYIDKLGGDSRKYRQAIEQAQKPESELFGDWWKQNGKYALGADYKKSTDYQRYLSEQAQKQCVCGEPNSAGTHRTDGPCLAPQQKQEPVAHWSDCAVHSEPAYPKGECDCGGFSPEKELFDSAREFYNATVGDSQVRITSKNESKRDVASEAANRLRNALIVYKDTSPPPVAEPHKRQPLTDEEIDGLLLEHEMMNQWPRQKQIHAFARAIEAAHGIKGKT